MNAAPSTFHRPEGMSRKEKVRDPALPSRCRGPRDCCAAPPAPRQLAEDLPPLAVVVLLLPLVVGASPPTGAAASPDMESAQLRV